MTALPFRLSHVIVKRSPGGLDDTQLRHLEQRLGYLRELEDRRQTILSSISEQGKLTDELRADIWRLTLKHDWKIFIYPINQNAALKGRIAIEAGLQPLADILLPIQT